MTLEAIKELIKTDQVISWLEAQWATLKPVIYLSCDIRHALFKVGIVDTNLFPAGFNNLCPSFSKTTSHALGEALRQQTPAAHKILLLGEDHTRNKFYLLNLARLQSLLESEGFEVKIGVVGDGFIESTLSIDLDGTPIQINKIERTQNQIHCSQFFPDVILSNNDFSSGFPPILSQLDIPIIPNPGLGWFQRRKSRHFTLLTQVIHDFSKQFGIDPWFLTPLNDVAMNVDLEDSASLTTLAHQVDLLIHQVRDKYQQHGIKETPYAYLKSDRGTYGLGLLPVFSGEEVLTLNRKKRNKLQSSKGKTTTTDYLIQEGIPTSDFYSGYPIEPVIYVVAKKDVGGFFRIHESKNETESLNAPGMTFSCLCLHKLNEPHEDYFLDCRKKEEVVILSRFLAQLAALAAAKE